MGCISLEKKLKDELGEEFQIACIGPGGESLVKYACISHDWGRQAGRGGVGAVMGSKKVKAIAVRGTKDIPLADVEGLIKHGRALFKACKDAPAMEAWQRYGTTSVVSWCDENGALPTRNFQAGAFEEGKNLYGEVMRQAIVKTDKGCFACPSPCGKYSYSKKHDLYVEGPEYETIALLGSNVALSNIEDVAKANWLCDELGTPRRRPVASNWNGAIPTWSSLSWKKLPAARASARCWPRGSSTRLLCGIRTAPTLLSTSRVWSRAGTTPTTPLRCFWPT